MGHNGSKWSFVLGVKPRKVVIQILLNCRMWFLRSYVEGSGFLKKDVTMKFHLQTDGQVECTIQTLGSMLRVCVVDFKVIRMIISF